ncbi:hypothetical protein G7054_g798 [Neopestalotiopsis clavispora]|nr:hypothetical protein G7054_g798 [Neopestalotiopsis clavispora]
MELSTSNTQSTGLLRLPDELLETIIQYLGPNDTVALGRTCKHGYKVTNSVLIWRRHCMDSWKRWDNSHEFDKKLSQPPPDTDWSQLFRARSQADREMLAIFDELLSTRRHRYQRMEKIAIRGLDAMDVLSGLEFNTPDSAADVLARRFHARALLAQIRRAGALDIWMRLGRGEQVSLEESLGAYDLFVFPEGRLGGGGLSEQFDNVAQRLRSSYAADEFDQLPLRQRAVRVAEFLRAQGLVGMSDETQYHALQNNFLHTAFTEHSSLPLQSAAVYCAVARRLGINAEPSNYPQHVYVVITGPQSHSSDETSPGQSEGGEDYIYLDPWRSSEEVAAEQLHLRLAQMSIPREEHERYLGPASVLDMTLRTARNIMVSVEEARHRASSAPFSVDLETAWYSMLWAMVLLGDKDDRTAFIRRRQFIPYLVQHFQAHSPEDIHLMEYVPPLFEIQREQLVLVQMVRVSREADADEIAPKNRDARNAGLQYKIGQYFKHKRYGYEGFVIGWDAHCAATDGWIAEMRVDDLPRGRQQPFYNIVADDKSTRYVAEENIQILLEEPPATLMDMAGRYFKRWNSDEMKFDSNMLDEYPDD